LVDDESRVSNEDLPVHPLYLDNLAMSTNYFNAPKWKN
jgi:hypothetical protein